MEIKYMFFDQLVLQHNNSHIQILTVLNKEQSYERLRHLLTFKFFSKYHTHRTYKLIMFAVTDPFMSIINSDSPYGKIC